MFFKWGRIMADELYDNLFNQNQIILDFAQTFYINNYNIENDYQYYKENIDKYALDENNNIINKIKVLAIWLIN